MPGGPKSDEFLKTVRAAVESDKALAPVAIQPIDMDGVSSNHVEALLVGNYAANPEQGRAALLEWYDRQLHRTGLNARSSGPGPSEICSTSHAAHYISARGAAIYLALRIRDFVVLETVCELAGRELCLWGLLRHPKSGRIIGAHGRSMFDPKGRDKADQRVEMATWYAAALGQRWREPESLKIGDDWLGVYALTKAQKLPGWDTTQAKLISYQDPSHLPLTKEKYVVRRGPGGLVAYFAEEDKWPTFVGSALWARSKFSEPVVRRNMGNTPDEEYGFSGPVPECPGENWRTYTLPQAGR